ncbi:MAG: TrmO family methyltransferase [Pseudomonadota bacterium]
MNISATPIGMFVTPFKTPEQIPLEADGSGIEIVIDVSPQHKAILEDIKEYPYITVMHQPHENAEMTRVVTFSEATESNNSMEVHSSEQIKPPALSVLRLKGILGSLMIVEGINILDQTPVLEIKAFVAGFDGCYAECFGWFEETSLG